jgi:hypothetical protein
MVAMNILRMNYAEKCGKITSKFKFGNHKFVMKSTLFVEYFFKNTQLPEFKCKESRSLSL